MGVAGAAWATILSQFISFGWVIYYFNSKHTKLRFRFREMRLRLKQVLRILAIGFSPCVMTAAMSIINVFMNNSLVKYGGDNAVAAMGIAFSILIVCFMPLQGLGQGAQPIIGYNYGAKKYDRVMRCFKLALICGISFLSFGWILIQLFPGTFVSIFTREGGELRQLGLRALRHCTIMFPVIAVQMLSSTYFQAVGKPVQSTILGMSRQLLFYLPMLVILPRFLGLDGVFYSLPASDILAVLFSSIFMLVEWKNLKKLAAEQEAGH
jgi:Na+-driven multidrug efflux pump